MREATKIPISTSAKRLSPTKGSYSATLTVRAPGGGVPAGAVTFSEGKTILCTAKLSRATARCTGPVAVASYLASYLPATHNYEAATSRGLLGPLG